jgi:predicted nucleic acid-binding Zn ribbon protein
MSGSNQECPRALSTILSELFAVRGYGRLHTLGALEEAWNRAVGEPDCQQTHVCELRNGVLNVTVAHSALLEELRAFRKVELLNALRSTAIAVTIRDIKFRIGPVANQSNQAANLLVQHAQPPSLRGKQGQR